RSRLLPAALVSVSLGDPRANGVAAWLKLAGKIVRITSSTDEVDHLSAKLRRIWWTCSWHRQHLWRETQGVHQTGSIPTRRRGRARLDGRQLRGGAAAGFRDLLCGRFRSKASHETCGQSGHGAAMPESSQQTAAGTPSWMLARVDPTPSFS